MKNIYIFVIAIFSFICFSSCDDFLRNDPPSTLPDYLAFETIKDCDNALNGVYYSMRNYVRPIPALIDPITDDIKQTRWGMNENPQIRKFEWTSTSFGVETSPWAAFYSQIIKSNRLLAGIEKFGDTPQTKRIKSEALMFRAMAHFELLRMYGYRYNKSTMQDDRGVPYVFEVNISPKPRLSVKQTLEFILADLEAAEKLMKDPLAEKRTGATSVCYLSLDALYAFQTRMYLYTEEHDKVVEAASKLTKYQLAASENEFKSIWVDDIPLNEVIFMIGIHATEAGEDLSISHSLYIRDKTSPGLAAPNYIPAKELLQLYTPTDWRWGAYFTENHPMAESTTDGGEKLTIVTKFPGNKALSTINRVNQTKYFRYAEVLLNEIEALYHTDQAKALVKLNAFREKRITGYTPVSLSGANLLNAIKMERRKEFAFEGMRFHDLRRWKDSFSRPSEKYMREGDALSLIKGDNYRWILPIPQHEINANSLKDYQNPKY